MALIIEDTEDDVIMLVRELQHIGYKVCYRCVDNMADLIEALNDVRMGWQVVFSDFTMPAFDGLEALKLVRQHNADIPFIFVSGTLGEDKAVQAVKEGAQDYIVKGSLKRLHAAIPRELRESENRRKRREVEAQLDYLTKYDEVTSLPNRALYMRHLHQAIARGADNGRMTGIMHINLDGFREINHGFGSDAGDQLLRDVARRLTECAGPDNLVARLAGDDFAVVIPDIGDQQALNDSVQSIFTCFQGPYSVSGYDLCIGASAGVSVSPLHGDNIDQLQRSASLAMHHAKQGGGKTLELFDPKMREKMHQRTRMERALRRATEHGEFALHYQPQVDLRSGEIVAVEALIRWTDPEFGPVPPPEFIPIAEESGLILPIGQWALTEACRQHKAWVSDLGAQITPRMAINVSPFQFRQRNLPLLITSALNAHEMAPASLEIEITESALLHDQDETWRIIHTLSDAGIRISLDDFGTGYSSLSYLKRFPVDALKIDREFVEDLPQGKDSIAIVRSVISIAQHLGLTVVAEGVETREQMAFVKQAGCPLVQGYYFHRPVEAQQLSLLLASSDPFADQLKDR
ncbi:EAL domain-containing protein [Marinobacterium aestuariivivens]|uniref:EAL domain-containing protein n=1 Tax=Marinobacterium aestuariivivens TaxID=1698799 RepID=A0ABW2A734_9GAMM